MDNNPDASPDPSDDRPNRWPWPPILQVVVLAAAYALERLVPLMAMPQQGAWRSAGWAVSTLGFALAISGIAHFRKVGAAVDPTGRARVLATSGIYAFTRNPMYLGVTVAYFGLAFALGSTWLLILACLMPIALQKLAIEREEAYLHRKFGADYDAYRAKVRRWV